VRDLFLWLDRNRAPDTHFYMGVQTSVRTYSQARHGKVRSARHSIPILFIKQRPSPPSRSPLPQDAPLCLFARILAWLTTLPPEQTEFPIRSDRRLLTTMFTNAGNPHPAKPALASQLRSIRWVGAPAPLSKYCTTTPMAANWVLFSAPG